MRFVHKGCGFPLRESTSFFVFLNTSELFQCGSLAECGHTFCQSCLYNWFYTLSPRPRIPEHILAQHYHAIREAIRLMQEQDKRKHRRFFSCPTCRAVIRTKPLKVLLLQDIVASVIKMHGEFAERGHSNLSNLKDGDAGCIWDTYFKD